MRDRDWLLCFIVFAFVAFVVGFHTEPTRDYRQPNCSRFCTIEYSPVCAEHMSTRTRKTYSNRCEFEVAQCRAKGRLRLLHEGTCEAPPSPASPPPPPSTPSTPSTPRRPLLGSSALRTGLRDRV